MHNTTHTTSLEGRFHAHLSSVASWDDRKFLENQFLPIPYRFKPKLLREYADIKKTQSRTDANIWAQELSRLFAGRGLDYAADDSEIVEAAEKAARDVRSKQPHFTSDEITLELLGNIADRYEITFPKFKKIEQLIARMSADKWWRRQLRNRLSKLEAAAIITGFVHKRAGLYASDETVNRRLKQRRKNARLLESLEAINDQTGQICTLAELAATNVSNPTIRRAELMTRISGMEKFANLNSLVGLFLTITTPSRMHARRSATCTANPNYDNTRPDVAQKYLLKKVWAVAQSKLKRNSVEYCGVRIVEPHHDGTPHWHMLVFVRPDQHVLLTSILREYALHESPDELGAQEHRFTVKQIDPAKGSAAGYVAKYIAKNIDGFAVGDDYEADTHTDTSESSVRVEAWASMWHIRQFQFFGTPAVTPYRELRRLESIPEALHGLLFDLWKAADEGDWCTYTKLHREGLRIKPLWEEKPSSTYQGELNKRVRGVIVNGEFRLTTREGEWLVREKNSAQRDRLFTPWTRVNNSTHNKNKGVQSDEALTYGNGEFGVRCKSNSNSLCAENRQEPDAQLAQKGRGCAKNNIQGNTCKNIFREQTGLRTKINNGRFKDVVSLTN